MDRLEFLKKMKTAVLAAGLLMIVLSVAIVVIQFSMVT